LDGYYPTLISILHSSRIYFFFAAHFSRCASNLICGSTAQVLEQSTEVKTQHIPLGPVAPMVAIKQLGSNGGGWYGPNSSVPLENPTPLSNVIEMIAILLIPLCGVYGGAFYST
jgi:K+-transporting ATPase ATPase A chain